MCGVCQLDFPPQYIHGFCCPGLISSIAVGGWLNKPLKIFNPAFYHYLPTSKLSAFLQNCKILSAFSE